MKKVIEGYSESVAHFLTKYQQQTNVKYAFGARDGKALKEILQKIDQMGVGIPNHQTFAYIIDNLPEWDKKNAFSLTNINNRFNVILANIQQQKRVSYGYKEKLASELFG